MGIIALIANGIQLLGVPAEIAAFAAKVVAFIVPALLVPPAVYVAVQPIEYDIDIQEIAILETASATIYADNVIFDIVGGYCGITGNYNVRLEGVAGIDLEQAKRYENWLGFNTWYELPEPNLVHLYVDNFTIVQETTSLGCRVDYSEARDLAQHLAKLNFTNDPLLDTLLLSAREKALSTFVETFGVDAEDVNFFDNDNGSKSSVYIPIQYNCWGLNDSVDGQFVKIC